MNDVTENGEMKEKYSRHLPFVDAVVFDFGGVMAPSPQGEWGAYALCAQAGLTRGMVDRGMDAHRHEFDAGFLTCAGMYRAIFHENGVPEPPAAWYAEIYQADSAGWRTPDPRTLALMRECKAAGKKAGILTNMSPAFFHDFFTSTYAEFRALADAEVVSGLECLYKPERPIYDLMARRLDLPPERLLFLDDLVRNVEAARRFGWRAEVFDGAD